MIDEVFVPFRPKGAEYAWMVAESRQQSMQRIDRLIMPLMDLAVRTRYRPSDDSCLS